MTAKCYILIYEDYGLGAVVYKTRKLAKEARANIKQMYGTNTRVATMIEKVKT